jgi:hypothetical protein
MNRLLPLFAVFLLSTPAMPAAPGDIGFVEDFALAPDRNVPLRELIPGTPSYYYYSCMHCQNTGELGQAEDILQRWIEKHGRSQQFVEMLNRQALLRYPDDPRRALNHIRQALDLSFSHARRERERETSYPTRLDPRLISREVLDKHAFAQDDLLGGFKDAAYRRLAGMDLSWERRRALLNSLALPDVPNLVDLLVADLGRKDSRGFGSLKIHRELTLAQLDACAKRLPSLLGNHDFAAEYLKRLVPKSDEDLAVPTVQRAYLERLQSFAESLPPAWNTLKANVLYRRLEFDRSQDVYDRARFLAYLRLPRSVGYVRRDYLRRREFQGVTVNLGQRVGDYPVLRDRIGDDEPLVRAFLHRFLTDVEGYGDFSPYLEETYLKEVYAEANILAGTGDQERWQAMIEPTRLRALKERVDIELLPTCRKRFAVEEPVRLSVAVKNVDSLLVRVYEINTFNYYRSTGTEVETTVDLDGLVANHELSFTYQQPALRRHVETFSFPELNRPGVWVVELIGNGRSSRAVIRKGRLRFTERIGAAGHVFRVYDQDSVPVKDATLWLGSQEYLPDADGEILVPFATGPATEKIVLRRGDFSALGSFAHVSETYQLRLDSRLPLESLVEGETAKLLVQPELSVCGVPVDMGLLQEPTLTLTTVDIRGVTTTKVYRDLELENDQFTACEFRVPEDLQVVLFELTGKVRNVSQGRDDRMSASRHVLANGIDAEARIVGVHVCPTRDGYVLEVLGKTGEPLPERVVNITLAHPEYSDGVHATLQTDKMGRIQLGPLTGFHELVATTGGSQRRLVLDPSRDGACRYPNSVQIVAGEAIELPFPDGGADQVSLLSGVGVGLRHGGEMRTVADAHEFARVADGVLTLRGLPAGDYLLVLRDGSGAERKRLRVSVLPGVRRLDQVLGPEWVMESRSPGFLGIVEAKMTAAGDKQRLAIRLRNPTSDTRVHVLGQRYAGSSWFDEGGASPATGSVFFPLPGCLYVSGRDLGDEFRYVLERRGVSKRPGNLLAKPSLLLNPWSVGKTATGKEQLRRGTNYRNVPQPSAAADMAMGGMEGGMGGGFGAGGGMDGEMGGGPSYDFLAHPALVVENLKPDANGVVTVELDLRGQQYLRVLATNGRDAVQVPVLLPLQDERTRDLRLRRDLPAERHFTEQKRVDIVAAGKAFTVPDMRSSKVRAYATLADVYGLLKTLGGNDTFTEFEFVCRWPKLSDEEKRTYYGKYACHELSFFVFQKDRAFFDQVVKPYLANKKDKTFLDHWLLGDDLSAYLSPWAYGRLNIVEQILLARRLPAQAEATRRHVQDLYDLVPPDVEAFNRRFDTAVKSASLDTGGGMALNEPEVLTERPAEANAAQVVTSSAPVSAKPAAPKQSLALNTEELAKEKKAAEMVGRARKAMARDKDELQFLDEALAAKQDRASDAKRREEARQLFRALDVTEEWVENNYYHVPIEQQTASLIQVNGFWRDYAAHAGDGPFLSTNFPEATRNFAEMMMALAVLDLPFEGGEPEPVFDGASMTFTPTHSVVVFHQQIREATAPKNAPPLLLGQNFFAADDRYRHEGNRKFDKFVTEEFQSSRIYGCQVVVTNPTSAPREIDLLLRIPLGAMPVNRGFRTRGVHVAVGAYATQTVDYYFYFPAPGNFPLYPVHASRNGELLAFAKPFQFHVVETLTKIDTTSWDYVSQYGSEDDVIAFLNANNIDRLNLELIAFRMKSKAFFARAIPLLRARHVFNSVLWSYGVLHNDAAAIREYLPHTPLADQCGMVFSSPLLTVDPVARMRYQHKEYWPLVNARAHRVGGRPRILNHQFHAQYTAFLTSLAYRPTLDDEDNLTLAMYLLLQDRVDEAIQAFGKVDSANLPERIQYDYLKAYLAFSESKPGDARRIARGYRVYPVPRWRKLFAEILAQCDEIDGETAAVVDEDNRDQAQAALAATQPSFEFVVENNEIRLDYQNLESVDVNFYRMDLELLFSRTPFLMDISDQFSVIRPNATQTVKLAKGKAARTIPLPKEFTTVNTMVEVAGVGQRQAKPYYPNTMTVQIIEAYGQIKVTRAGTRKPLAAAYVKVYARQRGGKVVFFKDGYTDLRGRFDYASVSTGDIGDVERFAILVLSEDAGAVVREAKAPTR